MLKIIVIAIVALAVIGGLIFWFFDELCNWFGNL